MTRIICAVSAALLVAAPASAEVKSADDTGFSIAMTATVAASPDQLWATLSQIGRWWNPAHSWSGDGANLSLTPVAGGCFCEQLPKSRGSVEHLRVVFADPGRMLRLTGGLGPLQSMAVAGVMDWTFKPAAGGTELSLRYTVSGAIPGGGKGLAGPVDQVLTEQFGRLKALAEKK